MAEVIGPALEAGRDVVCDRFSGSTLAYQGYGRGLDTGELAAAVGLGVGRHRARPGDPAPGPSVGGSARRAARGGADRMEGEGADFFARVQAGYAALAAADPFRWRVVDGSGTIDEVAARVAAAAIS